MLSGNFIQSYSHTMTDLLKTDPEHQKNNNHIPDWQNHVLAILASLAASRQTITYADLADLAALPSPHRIHKLADYLEQLIAEDITASRPVRAAVVISKRDHGLPADGFFDCCSGHGLIPDTGESRQAFHTRLLTAIYQLSSSD